jgi:hypothetical protein
MCRYESGDVSTNVFFAATGAVRTSATTAAGAGVALWTVTSTTAG